MPRLQYHYLTHVRQIILSDPPTISYKEFQMKTIGIPSIVWQQQMENACIKAYNDTNINQREPIDWENDFANDFQTTFRPISLIENYDPYYEDPQFGRDPYWDDEHYDQENLQFYYNFDKPTSEVELDNWETDRTMESFFNYVRIDLWSKKSSTAITFSDQH